MNTCRAAPLQITLVLVLLVGIAACSTAAPFPDPVPPDIAPQDRAAMADLLVAAVPAPGTPVRGIDTGPPDPVRVVLAASVVAKTGGPVDLAPARTLIANLQSGRFRPVPGGNDLPALRAALRMLPPAVRSSAIDIAFARSLGQWRPGDGSAAAAGALEVARLLRAQHGASFPASWDAVRTATSAYRDCREAPSTTAWSEAARQLAHQAGVHCLSHGPEAAAALSREAAAPPLERWRMLADSQLLAGVDHPAVVDPGEVRAAARRLEASLAGSGGYAAGASVPLGVAASVAASADDLNTTVELGPGNERLARAVAASGGTLVDLPAAGSVLDGVLGRVALRWTTGSDAGSARHLPDARPGSLDAVALELFGETAASTATSGRESRPAAPLARDAVAVLVEAIHESCDVRAITRFRTELDRSLAGGPGSADLRAAESGVAVWVVLGLQAIRSCADPAASALASRVQDLDESPARRGGDTPADRLTRRWVDEELACLSGRPAPPAPGLPPLTATSASQSAAASAVLGVGAISYLQLRTNRIEQAGCGSDVASVLRTW